MINLSIDYSPIDHITELMKHSDSDPVKRRIYEQIRFVCALSDHNGGAYADLLKKCDEILDERFRRYGGVTAETAEQIEQVLMPAAEEAKSYEYLCVAHAHIDMNWMWAYNETVSTVVDTFRTMLTLMEEYPDYHFSQSQASVYKIVEENDPEMFEEIKRRIKEGRWEVTASTWVEADKNIPLGESYARHVLYTKKYFEEAFDIPQDDLVIDFEPDTFGHNRNVPEISTQGGVKYYYHCRGHKGDKILHRWIAPSGADIIVYTEPFWYNATVDYNIAGYAPTVADLTQSKTLLKVYGVGDHGGGPTRHDIETLIEMNSWPVYPKFTFSTLKTYFEAVDHLKADLPILNDEINFLCDGCYTTQTTIKEGNRKTEMALNESEIYSSIAHEACGARYPSALYETAWQKTLFNQFHDIIPGSGVTATREYASGLYQQVLGAAQTSEKSAIKKLTDRMNTAALPWKDEDTAFTIAEGAGSGSDQCGRNTGRQRIYHIFNPAAFERRKITEITVWDYTGDYSKLEIRNSAGETVPYQLLEEGGYWGHSFRKLLVDVCVKACGYETIILSDTAHRPTTCSFFNDMRMQVPETFVLENDLIRAELDYYTGAIASIIDKKTSRELTDRKRTGGVFRLADEALNKEVTGWGPGMSAWFSGRYKHITEVNDNVEMVPYQCGDLRKAIKYETKFRNSDLTVIVSLDQHSTALRYDVTCNWKEFGSPLSAVPTLFFYLPLPYDCESYQYDVPFGSTMRKAANIEYPSGSYTFAPNAQGDKSFMLLSKAKHAFRCFDNSMSLTLIRGSYDPDPTPEIKTHHIEFSVNVLDTDSTPQKNARVSADFSHPFRAVTGTRHEGTLPLADSYAEVLEGSVIVAAIKESEYNDSLLIRVYETDGKDSRTVIQTKFTGKEACFLDLTERHTEGGSISFDPASGKISCVIPANSVRTIAIRKA